MYDKLQHGLLRAVQGKQESGTYTEACQSYAFRKLRALKYWNESKERSGRQKTRVRRKLNERKLTGA